MIKPSTKVYKKQILEGFSIPAIIHNGSYFFVDIDVYENGRVSCWHLEDFEHFKNDVHRGWVSTCIPENENISIHGLGDWQIQNGNWLFNNDSFIEYVHNLIKELNPNLENIYKYSEKKINGISVYESGNGKIYKELKNFKNDPFPEKIDGDSINLFYKKGVEYELVKVNIFNDDTIQLSRIKKPIDLTLEKFEQLIEQKKLISEIPPNSKVSIYGLGSFEIVKTSFVTKIKDKLLEVKDTLRELKGEPSTIDICIEAHQNYIDNPTEENREKLRISYENVPKHQRMFVGDMDTKDREVRMIIYGR